MTPEEMKQRTKKFALRVIGHVEARPKDHAANVIGRQLLRAGTSVGSHYRAACRARSQAEFIAKLGLGEEEADESIYWMELLIAAGTMKRQRTADLMNEANEILSMVVTSINTARGGQRTPRAGESAIRNPQSAMGPPQASGMARNHG